MKGISFLKKRNDRRMLRGGYRLHEVVERKMMEADFNMPSLHK